MGFLGFISNLDPVNLTIRAVGYGLAAASIIAFFVTGTTRKVVRAILAAGAKTPETAKSAADLGLTGPFARKTLKDGSALRKTVKKAAETGGFYIPEEDADRAQIRYVKKANPAAWIVGTALIVAATEAVVRLLPWMLSLFG